MVHLVAPETGQPRTASLLRCRVCWPMGSGKATQLSLKDIGPGPLYPRRAPFIPDTNHFTKRNLDFTFVPSSKMQCNANARRHPHQPNQPQLSNKDRRARSANGDLNLASRRPLGPERQRSAHMLPPPSPLPLPLPFPLRPFSLRCVRLPRKKTQKNIRTHTSQIMRWATHYSSAPCQRYISLRIQS